MKSRWLQDAVNALGPGRSNANGSFALTDDTATSGAGSSIKAAGLCPLTADARYHRFQVDVTGGFAHAQGVEVRAVPSGDY